MRIYDIIEKKKRKVALTESETEYVVNGYVTGEIPDYQMSAFLMAVWFNGMTGEETYNFTMSMAKSGDIFNYDGIPGIKVDKHSTGGVGDKTTLVLAPLIASCGVPVAKMSGRGLGFTGGTIDKLESIRGFNTAISREKFIHNVNTIGIALAGQTANLAPADKKIYALRDVTATVDSLPLIASSIMSKKLASGADAIVLDVKCGDGAFMKSREMAAQLAKEMVSIGSRAGKKTVAVITDMSVPLGRNIGNSLEVIEAIETLKGNGPHDLEELCLELGSHMLMLAGAAGDIDSGRHMLKEKIRNGAAYEKMLRFVEAQGGDIRMAEDTSLFERAKYMRAVYYRGAKAYIKSMKTEEIGRAVMILGGGRETKESTIDASVGIEILKKTGDVVEDGQTLAVIHGNDIAKICEAQKITEDAYNYDERAVKRPELILETITAYNAPAKPVVVEENRPFGEVKPVVLREDRPFGEVNLITLKPKRKNTDYSTLYRKMEKLNRLRSQLGEEIFQSFNKSFEVEYAHNSTAIEGNTLSLIQTKAVLEDGIPIGGKTLREIYEIVNHDKAFQFIKTCVAERKDLNENIVKDIHAILMENIMPGGIYRNVEVRITGAKHKPPAPNEMYRQIKKFYLDIRDISDMAKLNAMGLSDMAKLNAMESSDMAKLNAIESAARIHAEFVKIHPFADGNGRTSRMIMNYRLMAENFLPISINKENRLEYFEALESYATDGDLNPFSELVAALEEARLDEYIAAAGNIGAGNTVTENVAAGNTGADRQKKS